MIASLTFVWSIPSVLFGVLLVAASTILCLLAWGRSGYAWATGFLEALRFLLVLCVAVTLNQPEWRESYLPDQQPAVVVLWDESRSMDTEDISEMGGDSPRSRAEAIAPLLERSRWTELEERFEIVFEPFSSLEVDPREATDINSALEAVLARHANLHGIVLMTDGDWNAGAPPRRISGRLQRQKVPVFAIGVGSETPMPDIEVVRVDAPTFGVAGKPIRVPFTLESTLPRDFETSVSLRTGDGEAVSLPVRVPAMGRLQDTLTWTPKMTGEVTFAFSVPQAVGEIDLENNRMDSSITIREEQLKVLIIESFPRWEFRFLRNALERDPGVEVSCLLFHPSISSTGGGRGYIKAFPDDVALSEYDVVFLGDVGIEDGQLGEEDCLRLLRLVRDQAAGLVFLPGMRGNHYSILDTELGSLYPVVLDGARPRGVGSSLAARMELTEAGRKSLLTRFEDEDDENVQVWDTLPGFQWHAAALRTKAGAEMLASHRSAMGPFGRVPLIVTKTFGTGKILYMGTDSAWRWREGVEDKFHYRFWGQVARWMAYQRNISEGQFMRLFFTPDRPATGDVVMLNANVSSAAGEPLREGKVVVQIASPSGRTESVRLQSHGEESFGLFTGSFTPSEPGEYALLMTSDENPDTLSLTLDVQGKKLERIGEPARLDVLDEIAKVTGGKLVTSDEVDAAINAIGALPEPPFLERRVLLWCHPLWGGLIILLLAVFWTGRKVTGTI